MAKDEPLTLPQVRDSLHRLMLGMDHEFVKKNKITAAISLGKIKIQFWVGTDEAIDTEYILTIKKVDRQSKG